MLSGNARRVAGKVKRAVLRIRPLSATPYATHLPVLIGLAPLVKPQRVAEFGSGLYSTGLFLDSGLFPTVRHVDSWDDNADWAARVRSRLSGDDRLDLHVVDAVGTSVPELSPYDFIFIDDSMTYPERARTVRAVSVKLPVNAVAAVHDYEHRIYHKAASRFEERFTFRALTPQVLVAWNGDRLNRKDLKQLDARIHAGRHIDVTDSAGWTQHLFG